tara:strand:+ start:5541 stop:6218 length:678 start_codon:yes stop_codon:yes gene_type:complete
MARFTTGNTFSTSDQVTAAKLNNAVNNAALSADSVDDSTIELSSNALRIKDIGVTTAKIADDAITAAKIAAGALTDVVYPIDSIFITVTNYADSAAVVSAIGGTTWDAFGAGRVLVGQKSSDSDFNVAEEEGGAKTVTLSQAQMNHNHIWTTTGGSGADLSIALTSNGNRNNTFDGNGDSRELTSDGALSGTNHTDNNRELDSTSVTAHDNLQPYIVVYMWKRTA